MIILAVWDIVDARGGGTVDDRLAVLKSLCLAHAKREVVVAKARMSSIPQHSLVVRMGICAWQIVVA